MTEEKNTNAHAFATQTSESAGKGEEFIPMMCTVPEIARLTGLKPCSIRALCQQQKIPFYRCGTRFYIPFAEFKAFLMEEMNKNMRV